MTARTFQDECKLNRHPWTKAKAWDTFCALSNNIISPSKIKNPHHLNLKCYVNGDLRQNGSTNDMIFKLDICL